MPRYGSVPASRATSSAARSSAPRRRSIHGRSSRTASAARRSAAFLGSVTITSPSPSTVTRTRRARAERRIVYWRSDFSGAIGAVQPTTPGGGCHDARVSESRVPLPPGVRSPFTVYLNGVRQQPGVDFQVRGDALIFPDSSRRRASSASGSGSGAPGGSALRQGRPGRRHLGGRRPPARRPRARDRGAENLKRCAERRAAAKGHRAGTGARTAAYATRVCVRGGRRGARPIARTAPVGRHRAAGRGTQDHGADGSASAEAKYATAINSPAVREGLQGGATS